MTLRVLQGTAQPDLDPPVSFELLPGHFDSAWRWNSEAYARGQVFSLDDAEKTVYVVGWHSGSVNNTKAGLWRRVDSRGWEIYDLNRITSRPFLSVSGVDHHNYLVAGVDPNGRVLVNCQDLAGTHPKFAYSGAADLTTWTKPGTELPNSGLAVANPNRLAYPQLWRGPVGGKAYRLNREGDSGAGVDTISIWDEATQTWSIHKVLVDGVTGASPTHYGYHANIALDRARGRTWYAWMWRDDATTQFANYNIYPIWSPDDGVTWKDINGTTLTTPITPANAPAPALVTSRWSVDGIVPGLTMNGLAIDPDGHPHIAHQLYDANGETQAYHLYHDGSSWTDTKVTDFNWRSIMAQDTQLVSRLGIVCTTDRRTFIVGRATIDGRANRPVLWEATPASANVGKATVLMDVDLGFWEPSIDYEAMERGEDLLRMVVTPARPMPDTPDETELIANSAAGDLTDTPNWNTHWAGLIEVDLSKIDSVDRGHLPTLRSRGSSALVPSTTTSLSAMADMTPVVASSDAPISVPAQWVRDDDRVILVRMSVRAKVDDVAKRGYLSLVLVNDRTGTTTTVQQIGAPFEADTGAPRPQGINLASYRTYATDWTPLPVQGDDWTDGGILKLQGGMNIAGTLSVSGGTVEFAELVDARGLPGRRPRRRKLYEEDVIARRKDVIFDLDPDFIGSDVVGNSAAPTVYNARDPLRKGRYTVSQATGANQPTRRSGVVSGHQILRFDGVNDSLASTDLANTGRWRLWKGAYTLIAVFTGGIYGTAIRPILLFGGVYLGVSTTSKPVLTKVGSAAVTGATSLTSSPTILIASYGGGAAAGGKSDVAININGVDDLISTSSIPTVPDRSSTGGQGVSIGTYSGATGFFQGDLMRGLVIGRYWEAPERLAGARLLGAKYGITTP